MKYNIPENYEEQQFQILGNSVFATVNGLTHVSTNYYAHDEFAKHAILEQLKHSPHVIKLKELDNGEVFYQSDDYIKIFRRNMALKKIYYIVEDEA